GRRESGVGQRPLHLLTYSPLTIHLLFHVAGERVGDLALFFGAFVEDDAVTECERVALLHRVIAALLAAGEIVQAPGIGGKESVRANVPVRGIAEAGGVIQNRDAERFA